MPIFTELGQDLTHLAHKENTQNRRKILIAFCSLGVLIYSNIPCPMVEKLTLWGPHKLLKNLGAFSEYANAATLDQNKKNEILLSIMDTMEKW